MSPLGGVVVPPHERNTGDGGRKSTNDRRPARPLTGNQKMCFVDPVPAGSLPTPGPPARPLRGSGRPGGSGPGSNKTNFLLTCAGRARAAGPVVSPRGASASRLVSLWGERRTCAPGPPQAALVRLRPPRIPPSRPTVKAKASGPGSGPALTAARSGGSLRIYGPARAALAQGHKKGWEKCTNDFLKWYARGQSMKNALMMIRNALLLSLTASIFGVGGIRGALNGGRCGHRPPPTFGLWPLLLRMDYLKKINQWSPPAETLRTMMHHSRGAPAGGQLWTRSASLSRMQVCRMSDLKGPGCSPCIAIGDACPALALPWAGIKKRADQLVNPHHSHSVPYSVVRTCPGKAGSS